MVKGWKIKTGTVQSWVVAKVKRENSERARRVLKAIKIVWETKIGIW